MNAEPRPGEFDSLVDALRTVMREEQEHLREIDRMTAASFRLWLDSVAERLARITGYSLGRVRGYLGDLSTIVLNAGSTMVRSYRDGKDEGRRVPRRPAG